MPLVPAQLDPTVRPAGPPGVFEQVDAQPGSFGGYTAAALQKVGASTGQVGDAFSQGALVRQQEYNESGADQLNTQNDASARAAVAQFMTLRGADAMNGRQAILDQIEQQRQATKATAANPQMARMFDYMSRRSQMNYLNNVEYHAATEFKVWQGDVATGAITNSVNASAENWNDDNAFAKNIANIGIQADKLAALKGIDPASDAGVANRNHFVSEAWQARIHSVMAQDADTARQLFDQNADQIDAPHRANLDAQITQHQFMQMARDDAVANRADREAQTLLRNNQTTTEAQIFGNAIKGKFPSAGALADMVSTQQISKGGMETMLALQRRGEDMPDNSRAALDMYKNIYSGQASVQDVYDAAKAGHLKMTTAKSLMAAAAAQGGKADSMVARQARSSVMAAAGVPDGMINISHDDAVRKAQAETEWTNRVTIGGEDPAAVRDDMMTKYQPQNRPPTTWPAPRAGTISSSVDAKAAAVKTPQMFDSGQITQQQFDSEKALIVNYGKFFAAQDSANQARKAASAGKLGSGPQAKIKGQVPD